jgi:hypothetical protein
MGRLAWAADLGDWLKAKPDRRRFSGGEKGGDFARIKRL